MLQIAGIQSINQISLNLLSILIMTTLKGAFFFMVVYFIIHTLKKLSPEYKHLLWFFVICGFIVIPIVSVYAPIFHLGVFRSSKESGQIYRAFTVLLFPQFNNLTVAQIPVRSGSVVLSPDPLRAISPSLSWSSWALIIWVAGIVVSSMRIMIGKVALFRLSKRSCCKVIRKHTYMLKQLVKELGITHEVMLLKSTKCKIPFTYNVFKPTIVFPSEMDEWPEDRIRVVITHELAHIRRKDNLTQFIARTICSIFWFMPFIWIAYSNLYFEQEKAADSFVVNTEVKPTDYAEHLIGFASYTRNHIMLAGLYISIGRKIMLEKRILNVLDFQKNNIVSKGGKKMKLRNFILVVILITAFIALIGSSAATGETISEKDFFKQWIGTWINTDISAHCATPQKIICHADGTMVVYRDATETKKTNTFPFTLIDLWKDSEGNICFKATFEDPKFLETFYEYGKISVSNNTYEKIYSMTEPVEEWDLDNPKYIHVIYYR